MNMKKPQFNKRWITYGLTLVALLIFSGYIYKNFDRFVNIFQFSPLTFLFLLFLIIFSLIGNGVGNFLLYQALGLLITIQDSVGLAAVNTLGNQLPFSGGLIAKGVYLKNRFNLSYAKYITATGALYICFLATNGVMGLLSLTWIMIAAEDIFPILVFAGFTFMIGSIVLLWIPLKIPFLPVVWQERLKGMEEGWKTLSGNKTLIFQLVFVQIATVIAMAGRYWIAFRVFSQPVDFAGCVLFSSATILTRLVSISPGGLGIREGIVAGLSTILGFDPGVSAIAVGFDRLVATAIIAIVGTFFSYKLSKDVMDHIDLENE